MSVRRMLEEVKDALRPEQGLAAVRDDVLSTINRELDKRDIDAQAVPGGSVAKNTYLAGDHDVDVFVRFALQYAPDEHVLADLLEDALSQFSPERIHGSRDYFQFSRQGYEFEVVPVLAVEDARSARNVTDMSPLHVEYFLDRGEGLEDEVRLAKQFCKAVGVYGAESYIRGFSGHVIDLLIIHYGSFYELVKSAARWEAPVVIDPESHHEDPLSAIDASKHAPLVLVDPVQPDRNAAAALSEEQLERFVGRCREFLREPSEEHFIIEPFSLEDLQERLSAAEGAAVLVYASHGAQDKMDVAGARVRKAYERLVRAYEECGFSLVADGWHFSYRDESVLWFVVREHSLPRLAEHEGPPVSRSEDARRFRQAHDEVEEREGRLYARVERSVRRPEEVPAVLADDLSEHVGVDVRVERV